MPRSRKILKHAEDMEDRYIYNEKLLQLVHEDMMYQIYWHIFEITAAEEHANIQNV
jgi:hypothetical protein